jgi:hypothetical protein
MALNLLSVDAYEAIIKYLSFQKNHAKSLVNLWLSGDKMLSVKLHHAMLNSRHISNFVKKNPNKKSDLDIYIKVIREEWFDCAKVIEILKILNSTSESKILSLNVSKLHSPEDLSKLTHLVHIHVDIALNFSFAAKFPNLKSISAGILINDLPEHIFDNIKSLCVDTYELRLNKQFPQIKKLVTRKICSCDNLPLTLPENLEVLICNSRINDEDKIYGDLIENLSLTHYDRLTYLWYPFFNSSQHLAKFVCLKYLYIELGKVRCEDFLNIRATKLVLGDHVKLINVQTTYENVQSKIHYLETYSTEFLKVASYTKPKFFSCSYVPHVPHESLLSSAETLIARFASEQQALSFLDSVADLHPRIKNKTADKNIKCCEHLIVYKPFIMRTEQFNVFIRTFEEYVEKGFLSSVEFIGK